MSFATIHPGSLAPVKGPKAAATRSFGLRRNLLWTLIGNTVYATSQWAMLILLAKLSGPELVGQFALGLAITAPVFMLTNLQLRAVQATDARQDFHHADYLALRLITTAVAWAVLVGLVFGGGFRAETALVILAFGAAKGIESVSDVVYGQFQQYERMDKIAISMMIKGVLALGALGLAAALTGRTVWAIVGLAASWAAVLLAYDLPVSAALRLDSSAGALPLRPRWSRARLLRLTWLALPLGIVMMLISLIANIPRYFIEAELGERALGIFTAIAYLMVVGNTVVFALGQAASPRLARQFAAGEHEAFRALLLRLAGLALGGGGIAIALALGWGRVILRALYTAEYAQRADVFVWLTIAAAVGAVASFLGYGMTAARRFRVQAPLFAFVVLVTTFASALLIPRQGLLGAALATTIGATAQLLGSAWVIYAILRQGRTDQ